MRRKAKYQFFVGWVRHFVWAFDLDEWDVSVSLKALESDQWLAETKVYWEYRRAEIVVDERALKKAQKNHLVKAALHEVVHIVVNPLRLEAPGEWME